MTTTAINYDAAALVYDFSGYVDREKLSPIVTDDGIAGFQVVGESLLVLDGELIYVNQESHQTWAVVAFDQRHEAAARLYNNNPANNGVDGFGNSPATWISLYFQ